MTEQMELAIQCRVCRDVKTLKVNLDDLHRWKNGEVAQLAFPYLSVGDRELLISCTCGPCFDKMFGEE
jgi:hypothetical protein